VECLFQQRAIFHDPALDGGVVDGDTAFLHQLFNMAITQGIGHVPLYTGQNNALGKVCPLETDHLCSPVLVQAGFQGEIIPANRAGVKFATELSCPPGGTTMDVNYPEFTRQPTDVLTNDHHFVQEGFHIVFP
jgi:hypothetical protein